MKRTTVNPKPPSPAPAMTVRPDATTASALAAARRATGGAVPPHRLALAALTLGARAIAARPSLVFDVGEEERGPLEALEGGATAPSPSAPEPRAAPPGGPLEPRREAPAPTTATEAPPPPSGRATAEEVDAARAPVRAALAAGHSARALAAAAGEGWSGGVGRGVRALQGDAPLSINRATLAALVRGARAVLSEGGR
jgi:hypothetical protein